MNKIIYTLIISIGFGGYFSDNFLKYSTAYVSYSVNSPKYQEDRFAIVGGLGSGQLEVERTERNLDSDFQLSMGLRKIGRFKYEPKKGVKPAGNGGEWYSGREWAPNQSATLGSVNGWEYLIKWTKGRQWGEEYLNQESWLRYTGNWFVAKAGYTQIGLEDVEYAHADLRLKKVVKNLDVSVGFKHRQHPVYGFPATVLDTSWYKGSWWDFAEDAFGWDDNMWWVEGAGFGGEGEIEWEDLQLYAENPETGEIFEMENSPFWQGNGEFWGYDWYWADEDGEILAYTDREFFLYHFPELLEEYINDLKKNLGYQRETSLVIGVDLYHYTKNWWMHAWGNWLPYHYGHDKFSWHNANHLIEHQENGMGDHLFAYKKPMWMAWDDYDFGAIIGFKLQNNLGVFAEGRYLNYWNRPAYDFKFGVNYQFVKFFKVF